MYNSVDMYSDLSELVGVYCMSRMEMDSIQETLTLFVL